MTPRTPTRGALILAATVLLGACRSESAVTQPTDGADVTSEASATSQPLVATPDGTTGPASSPAATTPVSAPPVATSTERVPNATGQPPPDGTVPADADELVLSDSFEDETATWSGDTWAVDTPGEATAAVIDGVGVMATDARGTHEWVRAVAPGSTHDDVTLFARITPIESSQGTVFIGLHGDGEWQDRTHYYPLTGVVVDYAYSAVFAGEIVLIVFDGPDAVRIGPALGPVLDDGESAEIRFEIVDGRARVKIWRSEDDEPAEWSVEAETESTDGGVVQIAYRDGVNQSVAWDELTLQLWP